MYCYWLTILQSPKCRKSFEISLQSSQFVSKYSYSIESNSIPFHSNYLCVLTFEFFHSHNAHLGRNLIEYVLAWQHAINGILAQNESSVFQLNTYIISVLVIFFMQVNYDVPVISEMATVRSNSDAMKKAGALAKKDLANIDKLLADFFWFYGQRYQIWNHVISLNIGRWQERRIQDQQKHYMPNQKRYVS